MENFYQNEKGVWFQLFYNAVMIGYKNNHIVYDLEFFDFKFDNFKKFVDMDTIDEEGFQKLVDLKLKINE